MKKTMTEAAIDANRLNAANSTGPKTFTNTRNNAVKHGLLARTLVFHTEEEKKEFDDLVAGLREDRQPVGWVELALVEEIAVTYWHLAQTDALLISEQQNRRRAATAVLEAVSKNCHHDQIPFFREGDGSISAAQQGWDCHELVLRNSTRGSEQDNATTFGNKTLNVAALQIEAKLITSLDTIVRYHASLKRDYYRALRTLTELQEARRRHGGHERG